MDIFDAISEATTEANAFTDHAGKALSLEDRILYLQGLSLVMNADNDIHEEEKEYLRILIKSFDMDESILDSCLEFANAPDKDTIQDFFRAFRRKPIAQLFLFDAYVMMGRDGDSHKKEVNVINKIVEQLEILKGTQQDIYDLFCHIKNRNWQESALYFDSFLLDVDYFKHLLLYYEVDYDALMAETEKVRKDRLLEVLAGKSTVELKWEKINRPIEGKITTSRVNIKKYLRNVEMVIHYLQARLNRGELRVYQQQVSFTDASKEGRGSFFNLKGTGMTYDEYTNVLLLDKSQKFCAPDEAIESMLLFILPELGDSKNAESINVLLEALFNAVIAIVTDRNIRGVDSVDFPYVQNYDECEEEVFMLYKEGFVTKGPSQGMWVGHLAKEVNSSSLDVLMYESFRLMRWAS